MAKGRKPRAKKGTRVKQAAPELPARRVSLALLGKGALGVAVLGGAGLFAARAVNATVEEQDLTRIGNGRPTIVQVHDSSCRLCTQLQRNTRAALRALGDDELQYLVANIDTEAGSRFQGRQAVPHVTLVFFDGAGTRLDVLQGVREADELEEVFRQFAQR